ncbi:MAG TPA: ribonuclease P protein component [Phycisphaerales bacterium]|nr:ribonuclease P protein component [Phycisphaerales bacterium]
MTAPPGGRPLYRRRHRLTHANEFRAVYAARLKQVRGPLVVFAMGNTLGHPRLGLSVGRRVGPAVVRNTIKRRIRAAFAELAARWPEDRPGLDLVVVVRPHEARPMPAYLEMITSAADRLAATAHKRGAS